jgi:hypothetical protein
VFWRCTDVIVVWVQVSRGIVPVSPIAIDSGDTIVSLPMHGETCMDKSHLLPNNPARQEYPYTSVPIKVAQQVY